MSLGELLSSTLGWLGEFIQWVFSFVPRFTIVRCNQLAIRFVRGKQATKLEAGLHWYWPWCSKIDVIEVSRQSFLIPPIAVETADGVPLAVGAAVVYRIVDPILYWVENLDADSNIGEVAMAGLRDLIQAHKLVELAASAKEGTRFGDKLAGRMAKDLASFGVEVLSCRPTDQIRLSRTMWLFGIENRYGQK